MTQLEGLLSIWAHEAALVPSRWCKEDFVGFFTHTDNTSPFTTPWFVSVALAPESIPVLVFKVLLHLSTAEIHFIGELEMGPALATQD